MKEPTKYYLVRKKAVPEVLLKVVTAVQHITAAAVATIVSMILAWRKRGLVTVATFGVLAAIATEWLWKYLG